MRQTVAFKHADTGTANYTVETDYAKYWVDSSAKSFVVPQKGHFLLKCPNLFQYNV